MKLSLLLLIATVLVWLPARAAVRGPQSARVEMKVISLPQTLALALIATLRDDPSNGEAMVRLDGMIRGGEGALVAWLHAHPPGPQGSRSSSEEDQRYVIESAQAYLPGVYLPIRPPGGMAVPVVPTTFEIREVGFALEAESEVTPDGASIDVRCTSKETFLRGWTRAPAGITPSGIAISHPQPKFSTRSLTTQARVPNKRWILVGTFVMQGDVPRVELRFLRATITPGPNKP